MKGSKIKIITIILAVVLIVMVGILGVYTQVQNRMENQVKDYSFAKDLKGTRFVKLEVNNEEKKVIKDGEGKEVSGEDTLTDEELTQKGHHAENVPVNSADALTKENYKASKDAIEKRIKLMGQQDYTIRLDEESGAIYVELAENNDTDNIVSNLSAVSKFTITSELTGEELMNNSDIEDVNVTYGTYRDAPTSGTSVCLAIQFNSEGTKKLEEISTKYKDATKDAQNTSTENNTENQNTTETTNVDENGQPTSEGEQTETAGNVILSIDDEQIMKTSFDEVIRTGLLQLVYGQASTDQETIQDNIEKANATATLLRNEVMPIKYDITENKFVNSDITKDNLKQLAIIVSAIIGVILLGFIIKFKAKGLLVAIANVGLLALLLLTIRYTNVIISFEGLVAIIITAALNISFTGRMLCLITGKCIGKKVKIEPLSTNNAIKETYKKFFMLVLPAVIMSVTFSFIEWTPLNSFGMIMFWGFVLIAVYNAIITVSLLKLSDKKTGGANNEK